MKSTLAKEKKQTRRAKLRKSVIYTSEFHKYCKISEKLIGTATATVFQTDQRSDFKVAEPDFIAVVLQENSCLELCAEAGDVLVLAFGDCLQQRRALQFVFDDLRAVQPMLDVLALDEDARLVELADGLEPLRAIRRHQ